MKTVTIRKGSKKDISNILLLLYELERPKPKNHNESKEFKRKIKDYFSDRDKRIFVVEADGRVIGLVSIIFLSRLNQSMPEMYIPEFIVTKKFHNKGIGRIMIEYCIELAKKKKCHRIRLESGNQRVGAHQFYKKMGFSQTSLSFSLYPKSI